MTAQAQLFYEELPVRVVPSEMAGREFAAWLYAWKARGAKTIMRAMDDSEAYVVDPPLVHVVRQG